MVFLKLWLQTDPNMANRRRTFLKQATLLGLGTTQLDGFSTSRTAQLLSGLPPINFDSQSELTIRRIESFTRNEATIVKVTADDGSEGFGQLAPYANNITEQVLHQMIAHHFLGKDPYQITSLTERAIEANYKYPWSFICRATSGLETALWDLRGKKENKSVCQLLGGTPRPVAAYGSSMRRDIQPQDEAARIARLRDEQGFEAFKIRVGKVTGHDQDEWPGRTEAIIPAVRKAVGDDIMLQADANSCYSPAKAIEVGKMLQDHGYFFFEEPCPFWELEWTAEVNQALEMHVAGGEQDNDLAQWRRMIAMDAVDITQPDICYIGGIGRAMQVAQMAEAAGKMCVPHSANISLLTIFALHLMAAIPNAAPHLEYSIEKVAWAENIYTPLPTISDGKLRLPDGPGWGVSLRQDWLSGASREVSEKA